MLERGNGVPSRARVLWANLSAQGARVRERWLTRPLAPCSQLKAHSREREIGSQDCYSNMVKQCLTMFCRETLKHNTFCSETLKYNTFCRKNLDSARWAKKRQIAVRAESTCYDTLLVNNMDLEMLAHLKIPKHKLSLWIVYWYTNTKLHKDRITQMHPTGLWSIEGEVLDAKPSVYFAHLTYGTLSF